ncbi:myb-binding protein 1A isoform X1 [Schistocerca americana]|uniref:myb-binding protein 1A n=1 Tax=Schistocerca serialis cubense TaxID=2023355 RepID=UPI001F4FE490|nr:myb-binding protein 1A isoform X1 [Schistocerca americana]XP_049942933.1 myb-binding protein 1A [Schistocerca serialis cubense]
MASSGVVEEHMGEKSKQMQSIVSKIEGSVLDSFSKLTSSVEKQRISGAVYILNYLHLKESEFEKEGICLETSYTLNRLVRGLASPRLDSRAGFFSTLVGLLSSFSSIKIDDVFAAIDKELQSTGSKTKGETGEIYSGRVLAYGSFIESGLFLKGTAEQQKEIVKNLLDAGSKKSYLPLAAASFIIKILSSIDETLFHNVLWPVLKDEVGKPWENQSMETLYILLLASRQYPSVVKKKFMMKHLGTPGLIVEDSLKACGKLLMESPVHTADQHPVYEEFCRQLTESEHLILFWETGIDEQLSKPTNKRMTLAVDMLIYILKHLKDTTLIPQLLTSNFMMSVVKSFSGKKTENLLLEKMQHFLDIMIKLLEGASDKCRIAVIKKILFYPGDLFFEKHSGTKTVQLISKQLNTEGVKKLAKMYRHILNGSSSRKTGPNEADQQSWTGWERLYAAQLMTRLMGHQAVQEEMDWKVKQLQFFINIGLFHKSSSENEIAIRTPLAAGVKGCFFRALDQRMPKLDDLRTLLSRVTHYINAQMFDNEVPAVLRQPLSDKSLQAWKEMINVVQELEQKVGDGSDTSKEQKASVIPVFHTMFLHMGLQLFADPSMAEEALQELHSCLAHVSSGTHKSRRLRESQMENGEPHWVEVAVDLLLSLLSHNSHLLRSLAGCVFPHLCMHLTPTALHQILDVLNPNAEENPLTGRKDYSDSEDSSENEGDNESEDSDSSAKNNTNKQRKNKKMTTSSSVMPNEAHSGADANENSNSESDSDSEGTFLDDEMDEEDMKVNDKVRMAVQQALGSSAPLTDTESVDLDEMDEEEGKRLDAALSQAFSLLKQNKKAKESKKQSRDERALTHFRIRVIDLLEVYLATEPDMALCVDMLLPLFELLEFCIRDVHQKPLEMRIGSCLRKLSNVKKFSTVSDVNQKLLAEILTKLLDKGERKAAVYIDMSPKITVCCIFLLRCSEYLKNASSESSSKKKNKLQSGSQEIVDIYRTALEKFFNKRDCLLQVNLFDTALKILWEGNWTLVPFLVSAAFSPEVRPFRRNQAIDLLMAFYKNHRLLSAASEHQMKILAEIEKSISENSIKMLTQLAKSSSLKNAAGDAKDALTAQGVKQKFVCELLKLLLLIRHTHERCKVKNSVDWQAVASALTLYKEAAEMSTNTKAAFNKLCRVLNISAKKATKQKEEKPNGVFVDKIKEEVEKHTQELDYVNKDDVDEPSENDSNQGGSSEDDEAGSAVKLSKKKEKKKRKHSKNKALMKKESKQLRLNAVSEGMDNVTFSGIDIAEIKTDDDEAKNILVKGSYKIIQNGHVDGMDSSLDNVELSIKKRKHKEKSVSESVNRKKKKIDVSEL